MKCSKCKKQPATRYIREKNLYRVLCAGCTVLGLVWGAKPIRSKRG